MFTVTYYFCNILSCKMTEEIISWKVQLCVVSNNDMTGQQALLLLGRVMGRGGCGVRVQCKGLIQCILMRRGVVKSSRRQPAH